MTDTAETTASVRVWDWPVRVTHWLFALLIPAMWWTGEENEMGWHMRLGMLLLALLVFRIVWGLVGSSTARFASFMAGPVTVWRYLRGKGEFSGIGHNPLGSWSVAALLLAMLAQVSTGLFAGDPFDGATGPLNELVGVMTADSVTEFHEFFYNVIWVLVGVHLAAIAFYTFVKSDRLVGPMISGKRTVAPGIPGIEGVPAWRAFASLATGVAVAGWVWSGAPPLS